jgi:hypothetical protein
VRSRLARLELAPGRIRLSGRAVTVRLAPVFDNLPLQPLPQRVLALLQECPTTLETLSLTRILVLTEASADRAHTLVGGVETWMAGRMVAARGARVSLHAMVIVSDQDADSNTLAMHLLAWGTGLTSRVPRGQIAAVLRAHLMAASSAASAEVAHVVGVTRQAMFRYRHVERARQ